MHHIEPASVALPRSQSSSYVPCVTFVTDQRPYMSPRMDPNLIRLQEQRRFYYGIEVLATNKDKPVCLDFHRFLPVLPIFVSIAWLGGKYSSVDPIEQVDSLVLAKHLAPHIHVMPHFTAYRLTEKKLDAFLAQGFKNMLALRGDAVHQGQLYNDSIPILQRAKGGKSKRESISVFVAGHPEGYYTPGVGFSDMETHIKILKDKIRSEASGIITQMCYEPQTIINFVKRIRSDRAIAETPILVGIMIHEDFQAYERIVNLNGVRLPKLLSEELEKLAKQDDGSPHRVRDFFIHLNVHIIRQIMNADIGVYGFQFFTLNNFEAVEATLEELRHQKILIDIPMQKRSSSMYFKMTRTLIDMDEYSKENKRNCFKAGWQRFERIRSQFIKDMRGLTRAAQFSVEFKEANKILAEIGNLAANISKIEYTNLLITKAEELSQYSLVGIMRMASFKSLKDHDARKIYQALMKDMHRMNGDALQAIYRIYRWHDNHVNIRYR